MLSPDQSKAIELLLDFIRGNKLAFSLIGRPGTGKTFVIKEFVKELKKRRTHSYVMCTPTHKASKVLSEGSGEKVITVHHLLSLSPKVDIVDFDLKNLTFAFMGDAFLKTKSVFEDVVICDESSMINDDLFDHLLEQCEKHKAKIIFVGDYKQLQPVKINKLSKVFTLENRFELTTNHRQGEDPIVQLIEDSRKELITDFSKYDIEKLNLFTSAKAIMGESIEYFKTQMLIEFSELAKVLTYTNDRVHKFNTYIHNNITDEEYCFNELLTGYNTSEYIQNSEDYIVKKCEMTMKRLPNTNISVWGYNLEIRPLGDYSTVPINIFILPRDTDENLKLQIAFELEKLRTKAIKYRSEWKNYYLLERSFAIPFDLKFEDRLIKQKTLDYGYAMTVHKSQSSTYDVVYFDNNSLQFCYNKDEKRQLQYVALSRVKEQLNILV